MRAAALALRAVRAGPELLGRLNSQPSNLLMGASRQPPRTRNQKEREWRSRVVAAGHPVICAGAGAAATWTRATMHAVPIAASAESGTSDTARKAAAENATTDTLEH